MLKGRKIRNFLLPRVENNYKPKILESRSALIFGFLILFLFSLSIFFSNVVDNSVFNNQKSAVLTSTLVDLTNSQRTKQSADALDENKLLNLAAQLKLDDMVKNKYFAHISPSGLEPAHWLEEVGYDYEQAGENLAVNFDESIDVARAWINSSSHRENLIKSDYTEVGTAVGTSEYEGEQSVFVVQLYARPRTDSSNILNQITTSDLSNESNMILDSTKMFLNKDQILNYILIGLFIFIVIILLLNIFIKIKIQHKNIIINALILALLLIGLWLLNNFLINQNAFEFSNYQYTAYDF